MSAVDSRTDHVAHPDDTGTAGQGERVAFLVGAGRSGTTLLYKLLCLHPGIAFISNYESRYGWFPDGVAPRAIADHIDAKLHAWFNRSGNAYFVDRPWIKKLFPTPNEGESVYRDCGVPLFPRPGQLPDASTGARLRRRFEQMRRRAGADVFLSKRTANNRRIQYLHQIFPQARYVHLVRDGREVTQSLSTVEWWDQHTVWWDGRTPAEMERSGEQRLAICARNWVRELEELRAQLRSVSPDRVIELRYEELLRAPHAQLERVVNFLGVPYTADYRAAISALQLRPVHARWGDEWNEQQLQCVLREAQPLLRQLGYTN
jgi:omega-hydroxy-beta-dihydromenaquinone-9 sulfotransferase